MPRYTVQSPDGRKITLEGDSEPTEKDLDGIFASLPVKENPISEQEAWKAQYKQDQAAPAIPRVVDQVKSAIQGNIVDPAKAIASSLYGPVKGSYEIGQRAALDSLSGKNPVVSALKQFGTSGIEGSRRFGSDIVNAIRNAPESASQLSNPALSLAKQIKSVVPRTVSDEEAQKAFEENQVNKVYSDRTLGRDQSNVNESFAEGVSNIPQTLALATAIKGAIAGKAASKAARLQQGKDLLERTGMAREPALMTDKTKTLMKILQPAEEGTQSKLIGNQFNPAVDSLKPYFKRGTGAPGFVDAGNARILENNKAIRPILEQAPPELAPTPESIKMGFYDRMKAGNLADKTIENEWQSVATEMKDVTASNLADKASNLNKQLQSQYAQGEQPTMVRSKALQAARDTLSDNVHKILDATGDPDLGIRYKQNGQIFQMQDGIRSRYNRSTVDKGIAQAGGVSFPEAAGKVVSPIGGKVYKGIKLGKYLYNKLSPGEMGAINRDVERLMSYPAEK